MSEEWIRVRASLPGHHKLARLMTLLHVDNERALGLMAKFWLFVLANCWETANVEDYGALAVARASGWEGEPMEFITALRNCGAPREGAARGAGFLDGWVAHDFHDNVGLLVYNRLYARDHRKAPRAKQAAPATNPSAEAAIKVVEGWEKFAKHNGLLSAKRGGSIEVPGDLDAETFARVLDCAKDQPFLLGAGPDGWKMTFDWIKERIHYDAVLARKYVAYNAPTRAEAAGEVVEQSRKRTQEIMARRGAA